MWIKSTDDLLKKVYKAITTFSKVENYPDYCSEERLGYEQENLGYIYYYGKKGKNDYKKAFNYYLNDAATGNVRSLYKVGDFYRNGFYVEKNPEKAFHIYEQCAEIISAEQIPVVTAQVYMRLGECYYEGIGVEKNLLHAHKFMSMAENHLYRRIMAGDLYLKDNLKHVMEVLSGIREELRKEILMDMSYPGSNDNNDEAVKNESYIYIDDQERNEKESQEAEMNINGEPPMNDFDRIRKDWNRILEDIKDKNELLQEQVDTWLKPLRLYCLEDNELLIIVPAKDYVEILKKKYSRFIKAAIELKYDIPLEIRFITASEAKELSAKNNIALPVERKNNCAPLGYNNATISFTKTLF